MSHEAFYNERRGDEKKGDDEAFLKDKRRDKRNRRKKTSWEKTNDVILLLDVTLVPNLPMCEVATKKSVETYSNAK